MSGAASIVVAPDSFKGSIGADAAGLAIADGWRSARPRDAIVVLPQADGGEGTLAAIASSVPGSRLVDAGTVTGPDSRPVPGQWLELPDGVAVVELASVSGLPLMEHLDPLGAQTTGLGEVIAVALASGMRRVVVGLGGSASTDGGAGALVALGISMQDRHGAELSPGGAALARLSSVDDREFRRRPADGVVLLTDVDAPLLGPAGAAAVFGPQKGATAHQVRELDAALARFATVLGGDPAQPGAGAAGGTAFGFATAWGADIRPGAAFIAELTGLDAAMTDADLVITGEGRFDGTSLGGKVVGRMLAEARRHRVETIVVAGQVATRVVTPEGEPIGTIALDEIAGSAERAIGDPIPFLTEAGRQAALHWGTRRRPAEVDAG